MTAIFGQAMMAAMVGRESTRGPTAATVSTNIALIREAQNLNYTQVADRLAATGRPISAVGVRRIESGERRVDVDDLVALAVALGVSPVTLLVPIDTQHEDDLVSVTGVVDPLPAKTVWAWMRAEEAIDRTSDTTAMDVLRFVSRSAPAWRVRQYASGVQQLLELNKVERDMRSADPVVAEAAKARLDQMWKERQRGDD